MANLRLAIDPTGMEAGGARSETALRDVKREAKSTESAINQSSRNMGNSVSGFAAKAGRALGAAAASYVSFQAAAGSVRLSRSFNAALSETSTLIEGTDAEITQLAGSARSLARDFGGSATSQVQAFYQAISSGSESIADASDLLADANRLAVGGVTDVTTAVGVLSGVMNTYGRDVTDAGSVSDALFIGMKSGVTTVSELSSSIGRVLPSAKALNLTFDETVSAVAALTKNNLSTAEAVTSLNAALTGIIKPTAAARETAKELGLEFSAAGLQSKGLAQFMDDLVTATGGNVAAMSELFGSVEALKAALLFAGEAGGQYSEILEQMGTKAGATGEAYDKMASGLDQRWTRAVAAASDIALTLGNGLLTVLVPSLEAGAGAIGFLAQNADILAASIGIIAVAKLPALAAAAYSSVAALTASAAAAGAFGAALNLIPFVAAATGATLLYRAYKTNAEMAALSKRQQKELNAALVEYANTAAPAAKRAALELLAVREAEARANLISMEDALTNLQQSGISADSPAGRAVTKYREDLEGLRRTIAALKSETSSSPVVLTPDGLPPSKEVETTVAALERLAAAQANLSGLTGGLGGNVGGFGGVSADVSEYGQLASAIDLVTQAKLELVAIDARQGISETLSVAASLTSEMGVTTATAERLRATISNISTDGSFASQVTVLEAVIGQIEQTTGGAQNMNAAARAVYESLLDALSAATGLASINMSGPITAAANEASRLAANLANAAGQRIDAAVGGNVDFFDPRNEAGKSGVVTRTRGVPTQNRPGYVAPRVTSGASGSAGGAGGASGGGAAAIDRTKEAYDSLMGSLDPVIRATQQFEAGQETVNAAMKRGHITAGDSATAMGLLKERYEEATSAVSKSGSVWESFAQKGGSAIDKLIAGTASLRDVLKDLVKDLVLAIAKKNLLNANPGASSSSSVGSLIFKGLFGGFFDGGGTIGVGKTGVVGERGPELVTSTASGSVVTSRVNTHSKMRQSAPQVQRIEFVNNGLKISDSGEIMALVQARVAQQSQATVQQVKGSLSGWQQQLSTDGVLI